LRRMSKKSNRKKVDQFYLDVTVRCNDPGSENGSELARTGTIRLGASRRITPITKANLEELIRLLEQDLREREVEMEGYRKRWRENGINC